VHHEPFTVIIMTTQPTIRFFPFQLLRAGVCVLLVGGLLAGSGRSAAAQSATHPDVPAADAATIAQLADMLTSPLDARQDDALLQITNIAYRLPDVDLTPVVPGLVAIYKNHPIPQYRFAAISALLAIGDKAGMQAVRDGAFLEPLLRVQYVAVRATLEYFGPQAFGADAEAVALANNVLSRKQAARRLAKAHRGAPIASVNQ